MDVSRVTCGDNHDNIIGREVFDRAVNEVPFAFQGICVGIAGRNENISRGTLFYLRFQDLGPVEIEFDLSS